MKILQKLYQFKILTEELTFLVHGLGPWKGFPKIKLRNTEKIYVNSMDLKPNPVAIINIRIRIYLKSKPYRVT